MRTNILLTVAGLGFAAFMTPQTVHAEEISAAEVVEASDAETMESNTCDAQETVVEAQAVETQPETEAASPVVTTEENTSLDETVVTESVADADTAACDAAEDAAADTTETSTAENVNEIVDALPVLEDIVAVPADAQEAAAPVEETVTEPSNEAIVSDSTVEVTAQDDTADEYYIPAQRPIEPYFVEESSMAHLASYMTADGSLLTVETEEPAMVLIYSDAEISINGVPASMYGYAGITDHGEYYAMIPAAENVLVNSTNFRAQIISDNGGSNIVSVYTEDGILPVPVIPKEPETEEPKANEPETPVVVVPEKPETEEPAIEEPKSSEPETPDAPVPEESKTDEPKTPEVIAPEVPETETPAPVVTVESYEKEEAPVSEKIFLMTDDDMETETIVADTDDQVVTEPMIHIDRVLPQTGDNSYDMQLLLVLFAISGVAILVWSRKNVIK